MIYKTFFSISSLFHQGYKCLIETNLSFGREANKGHLQTALFFKDKSGDEAIIEKDKSAFCGYQMRQKYVKESKRTYFTTALHCDFLNCPRLLAPGCNLKFILSRQNDSFVMLNKESSKNYKIKIHELSIEYRSIETSRETLLRHQKRFESMPALYPFHKVKITHHTIPQNVQDYAIETMVSGILPQQVVINLLLTNLYRNVFINNVFLFSFVVLLRMTVSAGLKTKILIIFLILV